MLDESLSVYVTYGKRQTTMQTPIHNYFNNNLELPVNVILLSLNVGLNMRIWRGNPGRHRENMNTPH